MSKIKINISVVATLMIALCFYACKSTTSSKDEIQENTSESNQESTKSDVKTLHIDILELQDSLNALSKMGVIDKEAREILYQLLKNINDSADRAYYMEKIEINKKYGTTYDSLLTKRDQLVKTFSDITR